MDELRKTQSIAILGLFCIHGERFRPHQPFFDLRLRMGQSRQLVFTGLPRRISKKL
jgi:hypothetical protein